MASYTSPREMYTSLLSRFANREIETRKVNIPPFSTHVHHVSYKFDKYTEKNSLLERSAYSSID